MDEGPGKEHGIELFISYADQDEGLFENLKTHLRPLEHQGRVRRWHDRSGILPGEETDRKIEEYLQSADLILLLVSPDFIDSEERRTGEVKYAMERHEARAAKVIPVILRACDWRGQPFGSLEPLPPDGKPVTSHPNQDEAFLAVATGIRAAIDGQGDVLPREGAGMQMDLYVERMNHRYSVLGLSLVLPSIMDEPDPIALCRAFLQQKVREAPPETELPRDLEVEDDELCKSIRGESKDHDFLVCQRELFIAFTKERPAQPVLDIVSRLRAAFETTLKTMTTSPSRSGRSSCWPWIGQRTKRFEVSSKT